MSTLPGNPHAELAQANIDAEEVIPLRHDDDESVALRELAQIEATLAVAHELRTANLIALFSAPLAAHTEIATRLGLGGEGQ